MNGIKECVLCLKEEGGIEGNKRGMELRVVLFRGEGGGVRRGGREGLREEGGEGDGGSGRERERLSE